MIAYTNFENTCKRIAKYIMKESSNTSSEQFDDMIVYGQITVEVSKSLIGEFNTCKGKNIPKWVNQINKNLNGCSVKFKTLGYGMGWFIIYYIDFDDDDAEFEDW